MHRQDDERTRNRETKKVTLGKDYQNKTGSMTSHRRRLDMETDSLWNRGNTKALDLGFRENMGTETNHGLR